MYPSVLDISFEYSVAAKVDSCTVILDIFENNGVGRRPRISRRDESLEPRSNRINDCQGPRRPSSIDAYNAVLKAASEEDNVGPSGIDTGSGSAEGDVLEHPLLSIQAHANAAAVEPEVILYS